MTKVRTVFMMGLNRWVRGWGLKRPLFVFLLIAVVCELELSGCSVSTEQESKTAANQTAAQKPPVQPTAKPQTPQAQDLSLQELTVRDERGQTTLIVKFSQPVTQYRHFPLPQPARIVLDILGDAKRATQAETFRIDTSWVATLRLTPVEGNVRLVTDIAAATVPPYTITPENSGLKIVIGAVDPSATAKKDVILVKDGKRGDIRSAGAPPSSAKSSTRGDAHSAGDAQSPDKKYTGQKISLDFKDADIKNVFRLLGEVSGKNIVITDDVNRRVTVRLIEVPWDQAMDLIIYTNGLDKDETGNVIRISTNARFEADRVQQKKNERAKEEAEPLQTAYFNINYAKAKDLETKIKPLMTKRPDAALVTDERSNTIMLRDIQKTVDDASTLVAKLDQRTAQVVIESNLIETTPTFSRALGMELDLVTSRAIASSRFLAGSPYAGSANTVAPPFPVPSTGFKFGYIPNNVNAFLTAAENEGNVKIISRPSVVTLNNVPSTIKSERILRIALPSSTNIASGSGAAAGTAVATEKIPVGINLTVIPQVSSDGFVLMNIKVKSSSIANSPTVSGGTAGVIPFDELNREAEANVLVRDGETIVIGGILKDTGQESESGVPYLKDIPILGWLFKSHRWQKDFEELVVFITPRIASAGSENLPTADQLWREQMKKTQGEPTTSIFSAP